MTLYFASQGAGRLLWPVFGNIVRLAVAVTGGWLALRWGGGLAAVAWTDTVMVCGMALGYADESALVNTFQTTRVNAQDFTHWVE